MTTTLIRRISDKEDRAAVLAYVRKKYAQLFGTVPEESEVYFSATREGVIVGTIALEFCNASGHMPLEEIFEINPATMPVIADAQRGAQFGRWIAEDSVTSLSLLYPACVHAVELGKDQGWLCHNNAVHRILTKKGVQFFFLSDKIIPEGVPAGDLKFYTSPPFPKCYLVPLRPVIEILRPIVESFTTEGKIKLG